MRERVKLLNGRLNLASQPQKGTDLTVFIPFSEL
jgi:signal transduction histidine kinase